MKKDVIFKVIAEYPKGSPAGTRIIIKGDNIVKIKELEQYPHLFKRRKEDRVLALSEDDKILSIESNIGREKPITFSIGDIVLIENHTENVIIGFSQRKVIGTNRPIYHAVLRSRLNVMLKTKTSLNNLAESIGTAKLTKDKYPVNQYMNLFAVTTKGLVTGILITSQIFESRFSKFSKLFYLKDNALSEAEEMKKDVPMFSYNEILNSLLNKDKRFEHNTTLFARLKEMFKTKKTNK